LEVHIDKGMRGGQKITFQGESDQAPDTTPGDVVIVIEEKPHERFARDGDNLKVDMEIDLLTALAGGQFALKHLDDRYLLIDILPGSPVKEGEIRVISGQGMPSYRHHEPGDLYIKFHIKFPEQVDAATITKLEAALPPRNPVEKIPKNTVVDEVALLELDARQQREAQARGDAMDEDEDQPRVQCANQ